MGRGFLSVVSTCLFLSPDTRRASVRCAAGTSRGFPGTGEGYLVPSHPTPAISGLPSLPLRDGGHWGKAFFSPTLTALLLSVPLPVWLAFAVFHHAGLFLLEVKYWK